MPRQHQPDDLAPVRLLRYGRVKEALARIQAGSDPNEVDEDFHTPILYAAVQGSWAAFEALAGRGADLTWRGRDGESLFDYAFAGMARANWRNWSQRQIRECRKMIEFLAERGLLTPAQQAVTVLARNRWKEVKALLQDGLSPDATQPDWHCEIAPLDQEQRIASTFLRSKAHKNSPTPRSNPTLLMWAAALSRFDLYQSLVACGADESRTDAFGHTAKDYLDFYRRKHSGQEV